MEKGVTAAVETCMCMHFCSVSVTHVTTYTYALCDYVRVMVHTHPNSPVTVPVRTHLSIAHSLLHTQAYSHIVRLTPLQSATAQARHDSDSDISAPRPPPKAAKAAGSKKAGPRAAWQTSRNPSVREEPYLVCACSAKLYCVRRQVGDCAAQF